MNWQIAVALNLVLSTSFSLLQRHFSQKYPGKAQISTALMYLCFLTPISWAAALIIGDVSFDFQAITWIFIILGGILFALGNIAAFDASTHVDAGQFNIIANIRTITTILVSSIVLGETLTSQQLIGATVIMIAAVLIAMTRFTNNTRKFDRHTLIAMGSSIFFGLAFSNEKWLLDQMSFSTYLLIGWTFQTIAMVLIASRSNTARQVMNLIQDTSYMKKIGTLGVLRTIAGFMVVLALQDSGNSSLVVNIFSYKTALVVVAAYFILKERDHMLQKLIGATCATIGLLLLI